ncbi:MAG TPA: Rieske 2Fe-2S domain-containing protein [Gaiellales bacterium]|jgi:nitrite reductase/ring-hydroxylating ferredoxin subunit|nr:Rieske 2Fe-2S domain-containing protein [Gaiellales bacterium]
MQTAAPESVVRVASLNELQAAGRLVVRAGRHTVCLFADGDRVHAVDNRCPHMGFPLHRGTVCDGILTCHWHHARFDLATGGTFDQFADELRRFPVTIDGDDVLIDAGPVADAAAHQRKRLQDGLERDISLVIAKAAIALLESDPSGVEVFQAGIDFGVARRGGGWFRGLTTLTCLMNLLPRLEPSERAPALYHGLADVAADSAAEPPRFPLDPLPGPAPAQERLAAWFRDFVDVRDAEGAERALVSAIRGGARPAALADMLFAAASDHRYLDGGHTLDFVNKALEALDTAGWERAEAVLASLPAQLAGAERMEEANSWRNPVDLVALLEAAFAELPAALAAGAAGGVLDRPALVETILEDEPAAIVDAILSALRQGAGAVDLASAVSFAAARRIARFPTSNEFGDWDTALHTFTFANAVEQGLRRSPSPALLRGVLDGAISVHLDRFLNVPAARLPEGDPDADPAALLAALPGILDRRQQVDEAAAIVASFVAAGGDDRELIAALGAALVRENRNFHTIQCVEAAVRQHELLAGETDAALPLVAAARYLAAHATTSRSQRQTFDIARRLQRGETLYEEADGTTPS